MARARGPGRGRSGFAGLRLMVSGLMVLAILGSVGTLGLGTPPAAAMEGKLEGGPCGICGKWIPAGQTCPCWSRGGGNRGGSRFRDTGPTAEELAWQRRMEEGRKFKAEGLDFVNKKNWFQAIQSLREARKRLGDDPEVKKYLEQAEKELDEIDRQQGLARAKVVAEEVAKSQNAESEKRQAMAGAEARVGNLLKDLDPDFDGTRASGAKPAGQPGLEFLGSSGAKPASGWDDPNVVDLRDATSKTVNMKVVSGGLPPASQAGKLDFMVPGQASPEKSKPAPARVTQLSDADLEAELARTRKIFERMRDGFQADVKDLQSWAHESQDAQREAIKESLGVFTDLLKTKLAERAKEIPDFDSKGKELQKAAEKLCQDMVKTAKDYKESDKDRQSRLEAAQALLQSGYDFLTEADNKLNLSKNGSQATAFAGYLVNYTYHASRWAVANQQIRMIVDHLDGPNGKLEAQKVLAKYHESLVEEAKRRKAAQP